MYQGVITQCRGVAHNSRFSDFSSISRIISFSLFNICTYGALFSSQFSCNMGHVPSHIFAALCEAFTIPHIFNGASILPILGCFHCTLHLPSLWSVSILMGHLSIPFHQLIISLDSWGTYPSHSHFCSSNISHFWHTWSPRLFF